MIIRARTVVTLNGPPIENGAVAIEGKSIAEVGTFREIKARNQDRVLDLGEQILLPGLINAHCHLDYTMLRGRIAPQKSFTEWIRQINAAKATFGANDYARAIEEGFAEARRFGTTTIINLEAFPDLIRKISTPPIRTWWCAELIDVRERVEPDKIVATMHSVVDEQKGFLGGLGIAPHAPYTASTELYAQCTGLARNENLVLTTHLSESREEMEMFRDGGGALFDFMKSIGRLMGDCGSRTPLAYLIEKARLHDRWLVAHLNELTVEDFRRLADAEKFHIAHCPCSHRYFGRPPFPLQKLQALGFNICLGTDSLASNSSLSLFAEIRMLRQQELALSPRELLEMVTLNPARALRMETRLGRIAPGFLADLISIPSSVNDDVFEQVLAQESSVSWMMVNGRAVDAG